jgi:SpoVK/Ycf46/Vps4 family AAA+-type ATPase
LDAQIVRSLLGQSGADLRFAPFAKLIRPAASLDKVAVESETKHVLDQLVLDAQTTKKPLKLFFSGPPGGGQARIAEALAHAAGMSLFCIDLTRAPASDGDIYPNLFREGFLRNAILYVQGEDALTKESNVDAWRFCEAWANAPGITIVSGNPDGSLGKRMPRDVITVPFARPDFSQRRAAWETNLREQNIVVDDAELDAITGRFQLTLDQIANAAALARQQLRWHAAAHRMEETALSDAIVRAEFFGAARRESGEMLTALARKIAPMHTWDDLVLPDDAFVQLREICQRVAQQHRVMQEWGFGHKLALGRGVNALFAGPSGTGKTTAAEVIASELGLDLYKIELANIVSKYIGETEKNLERIFTAAENANVILFFDEADALFGKRSEVRDSHDRYANIEIAYLLQKIEQYDGVAILATNLRQNMDDAFVRRLQFIVEFPFPGETERAQIWRLHFPANAPRDPALDFDLLAHHFRLSGGNIKNIVLSAAFLAASDGGHIAMPHLMQATRREYQKMGKVLPEVGKSAPPGEPE